MAKKTKKWEVYQRVDGKLVAVAEKEWNAQEISVVLVESRGLKAKEVERIFAMKRGDVDFIADLTFIRVQ